MSITIIPTTKGLLSFDDQRGICSLVSWKDRNFADTPAPTGDKAYAEALRNFNEQVLEHLNKNLVESIDKEKIAHLKELIKAHGQQRNSLYELACKLFNSLNPATNVPPPATTGDVLNNS